MKSTRQALQHIDLACGGNGDRAAAFHADCNEILRAAEAQARAGNQTTAQAEAAARAKALIARAPKPKHNDHNDHSKPKPPPPAFNRAARDARLRAATKKYDDEVAAGLRDPQEHEKEERDLRTRVSPIAAAALTPPKIPAAKGKAMRWLVAKISTAAKAAAADNRLSITAGIIAEIIRRGGYGRAQAPQSIGEWRAHIAAQWPAITPQLRNRALARAAKQGLIAAVSRRREDHKSRDHSRRITIRHLIAKLTQKSDARLRAIIAIYYRTMPRPADQKIESRIQTPTAIAKDALVSLKLAATFTRQLILFDLTPPPPSG